jgi:hypothetical protein
MPAQILLVNGRNKSTANHNYKAVMVYSQPLDFLETRDMRILSITSSGWVLSMRDSAEGGSRNSMPMLWVTLHGLNIDVVGPTHYPLEFQGVDGLTIYLKLPHFLIADAKFQADWDFDMRASCYYEFI